MTLEVNNNEKDTKIRKKDNIVDKFNSCNQYKYNIVMMIIMIILLMVVIMKIEVIMVTTETIK